MVKKKIIDILYKLKTKIKNRIVMCLPVNCLKTYTGIAAFLTMALGITGFVFGVIFAFEGDLFIGDLKSPQKITSYSMLGLGVILILIGITGLVGACKKSSCCLGIHNIGIFIFMIVFFAIGITGLVIFKKYEKQISNDLECKNSSNFDKADQFAVEAEKYFCKFGGCACGAKADKLPSNIYNKLNVIVGGPVKIQDCPEYSSVSIYYIFINIISFNYFFIFFFQLL